MPNPTPPDAEQPDPELPRAVALAWGVAAHPQRGPKRELSIERIVEAAIEIADAEGLGAVSMSRVADLARLHDDVALPLRDEQGRPDPAHAGGGERGRPCPTRPSSAAGATASRAWVLAMRDAYRAHPWLVDIPISGAPITPNSLTIVDWFLREVRDLPLSDGEKMSALLLLTSYARATSAQERDLGARGRGLRPRRTSRARTPSARSSSSSRPSGSPYLAARCSSPAATSPSPARAAVEGDDDFEFGLQRILDGIEYHVGRVESGAGRRAAPQPPAPEIALPRDKQVREAAKARREAEKALREAQKREREAIKRALERERHDASSRTRARERERRDGSGANANGSGSNANANGSIAPSEAGRMPRLSAGRSSPGRAS